MRFLGFILIGFILFSCKKENTETGMIFPVNEESTSLIEIPKGFPELDPIIEKNITPAKVALGKKLFFDPILSRTGKISCGSCHKKNIAFTDGHAFPEGVDGQLGNRSSPSLVNLAWSTEFMWSGGPQSLEAQVVLPFDDHREFDLSRVDAINKLLAITEYVELFDKAYNKKVTPTLLSNAIAMYERTIVSGNSNFDKFEYQGNKSALSANAIKGKTLFSSEKFKCNQCHVPPLFTNFEFINNGIYSSVGDSGRYAITIHSPDKGKFKVPTLRNIEVTTPYMHDGRFKTLEEVIDFYGSGGGKYITQDSRITQKDISKEEKDALVAFLKSLTDQNFLTSRSSTY